MKMRLLTTTALAVALAVPALAQDVKPAPVPQSKPPLALDDPAKQRSPGAATAAPSADEPSAKRQRKPAAERLPSGDKIIVMQVDNELLASQLIGKAAFSLANEKLGTVEDVLFDKDGKVSGLVLSVGGFLGIGAKSVGLDWETSVRRAHDELVVVDVTGDELESAPGFKTLEDIAAERQAMRLQQERQLPMQPASPAPSQTTQ